MRNHICIFELKTDKCLGFKVSQNGKQFILINQLKSAFVLERILDSRKLKLVCEKNMNETFQSDFFIKNYDPIIISPSYLI